MDKKVRHIDFSFGTSLRNAREKQNSWSSGCREMIQAHCFGESGAETDASSEENTAQFHSRSRNTFSSCSVMVISFHWFF